MALYEYKCRKCGEVAEYLMDSSSGNPVCRSCGSDDMEKQLSTFAVSVKSGPSAGPAPSCPNGSCCGGSCGLN